MQVQMEKRELNQLRWGWFRGGCLITLLMVAVIIGIATNSNSQLSSTVINPVTTGKFLTAEVRDFSTDNAISKPKSGATMLQFEDWQLFYFLPLGVLFLATFIYLLYSSVKRARQQRKLRKKPEGFWDWNSDELKP